MPEGIEEPVTIYRATALLAIAMLLACFGGAGEAKPTASAAQENAVTTATSSTAATAEKIVKSDEEWKQLLTPEQYRILRQKGTERAFTGALWNVHDRGTYVCAACALPLFSSETKFESGTGWPSFWQPIEAHAIETESDWSWGGRRTEVHCRRCGGHLGHVFPDGPRPTGLRYCINSASVTLEPEAG